MSGKATGIAQEKFGNGMPFDKLDELVISWGRAKYGEKYAKALWRDELVVLKDLNLEDDLDKYKFDEHCSLVNDVIACDSPKYAASLLKDKRFTTLVFDSARSSFASLKLCARKRQRGNC